VAKLRLGDRVLDCEDGETVLDALHRQGIDVPSSCRNGVCQSCMLRCRSGDPGDGAQKELKESLRVQGYFLACQCRPTENLALSIGEVEGLFVPARIADRRLLAPRIAQVLIEVETPLEYRAGQFIHLRRDDGLVRSYSLASETSAGPLLELHVTRLDGGRMSSWLHDEARIGHALTVRGPLGDCFYVPGREDQNLLLVGTGSGLAPLLGILRSALVAGHTGEIHLYHGSTSADGLYLVSELRDLAARHRHVHYHPCVDANPREGMREARADLAALADHTDLAGWRVYLCGHPGLVKSMKKMAYLQGASLSDILADPFETARN
jgi:NAD(P)H-flavin reductase/ferredoxin